MMQVHEFRRSRVGLAAVGVVIGALALGACATKPRAPRYPELTYGHHGVIGLDVASVEFRSTFVPPRKPPHVEHLSPANPVVAMERWTNDRLRAVGREGTARVVLSNASLIETPLRVTGGVRGWFTTEQAARYDAAIEIAVQIIDAGGVQRAYTLARADRSRTVSENTTLAEREKVLFDLVEATTTEINGELDKSIRQFLQRYIIQQ